MNAAYLTLALLLAQPEASCRIEVKNDAGRPLSEGTGTVIARQDDLALVLTCAHTFYEPSFRDRLPAGSIECYFARQRTLKGATLLACDPNLDVAALLIRADATTACAPLAEDEPEQATPVAYYGYPLGSWTQKAVSTYYRHGWLNSPAQSGDSGSGILANGRLIAMVQGTTPTHAVCCRCRPLRDWLRRHVQQRVQWCFT